MGRIAEDYNIDFEMSAKEVMEYGIMMTNQYEVKIWLKDGVDIEDAVDFLMDVFDRVPEENFSLDGQTLTISANGEDEDAAMSLGYLDLYDYPDFWRNEIKRMWVFYRDEPLEDDNLLEFYERKEKNRIQRDGN